MVASLNFKADQETVLVTGLPQETKIAFYTGTELMEFRAERDFAQQLVGNIYIGKVLRVLPGMQSAFIDIGIEKPAFVHYGDLVENKLFSYEETAIEKVLYQGQRVWVQVVKEPMGSKGARVTTQLSLVGRHLVYLPQADSVWISQHIEDSETKEQLKNRLLALTKGGNGGGYIIRTRAQKVCDEEFVRDINFLHQCWQEINEKARLSRAPALIHKELSLPLRLLRDCIDESVDKIVVDSLRLFEEMQEFADIFCPKIVAHKLQYRCPSNGQTLFSYYEVEKEIEKALNKEVRLRHGSYLIIESTETLTTIDVNTGGFVGRNNFEQTVLQTNLEACRAIAQALRLRNIAGMVVIDFIAMKNVEHQEEVLRTLAHYLQRDKTRVTLFGFTALGLVELTRKRTRPSLATFLLEKCDQCLGSGNKKSVKTISYQLMHTLYEKASSHLGDRYIIKGAPEVIAFLQDEGQKGLTALVQALNLDLILQSQGDFKREQYVIEEERHR